MVHCQIRLLKDRCKLKLIGGDLIVSCLAGNAKFQCPCLQVLHKGGNAHGDRTEVVVVHLLVLCAIVTKKGAPCHK